MMYAAKYDWKNAAVFTIAAVLLSLIIGTLLAIPIALAYGITGVVMGTLIRLEKSTFIVFVAGSLVFLANTIVQYVVTVVFFNINIIGELKTAFEESVKMSVSMLESFGQTPDENLLKQFETMVDLVEILMPSMLVMASFMIIFLIMLVSFPILRRFGIKVNKWKPFREITLPKSLLWYYLIALIATIFVQPEVGSYWHWALTNLNFILQFFMLIQGFTFIAYFSHLKGYTKAVPIVAIILALLLPVILYIVRILGIIDLGFDLRQRLQQNKK